MNLENLLVVADNKLTGERCTVILIDFSNREVEVLPESELEGGNTVSWPFKDINLLMKLS